MLDWDERYMVRKSYYVTGTKKMGQTLNAAAAVAVGDDSVKIACTGHGLSVDAVIFIAGTVNYNGYHTITAKGDNDFTFVATFEAENIEANDTLSHRLLPGELYRLVEVRLHLDAAPTTASDDFTVTIDSGENAVYDAILETQDMDTLADHNKSWGKDACHHFKATDAIIFAWANAESKTWGLEVIYDMVQS